MVLQYGDIGRSFPKDTIFACKQTVFVNKQCLEYTSKNKYCSNGIHCSG